MDASTAHFTARIQALETGTPGKIGHDTTHHIMGRRSDRDFVLSWIDAAGEADLVDAGKPARKTAPEFSRVKKYGIARLLFAENFAGHNVAWRQLG